MGVDYSSCAGYTVELPEGLIKDLMAKHNAADEWELFENLGLAYGEWGDRCYGGDGGHVLLCRPTPGKMDVEIQAWLNKVNATCETSFEVKDVKWFNEVHAY